MRENIERAILYTLLVVVILVTVADFLDLPDQYSWISDRVPTFTLLLVTAVTVYWITEQQKERKQLDRVEELAALSGVGIRTFESTDEAMGYLARRYLEAKSSIDQVATAPSLTPAKAYEDYDQTLNQVLAKNTLKYRHIVALDATRWNRVKAFLLNANIQKYYVTYYERQQGGIPGFSYAIVDESEIVMRYPYSPEQSELWLSTKHPEVVRLFLAYSRNLWERGTRLEPKDSSLIDRLDSQYSSSSN